jgi:hypothetical protein
MKKRSGSVKSTDPLVSFIYDLTRDHVPSGIIEGIMNGLPKEGQEVEFTNGWLAEYSKDVADRLRFSIRKKK